MAAIKIPKIITVPPTGKHTATLFFFHGSGDSASNMKEWLDILNRKAFKLPHIKIIYPQAPEQPYTPLEGSPSNVWFDRKQIDIKVPEVKESVDQMCELTSQLIDKEIEEGVPINRIAVGGFSMGGALSLHIAYRYKTSIAGCVAISSFLNDNSLVYEALKVNGGKDTPPLLQFHGLADLLVPFSWGEKTHNTLESLGVKAKLIKFPGVEHEVVKSEIQKLSDWLVEILPNSS